MQKIVASLFILSTFCMSIEPFYTEIEKSKDKLTHQIFNHYDKNKNSFLSFKEFSIFLKDVKEKTIKKRIEENIKICDKNNNNMIEFNETLSRDKMLEMLRNDKLSSKICRLDKELFKRADKNNNKIVSKEELYSFFKEGRLAIRDNKKQKDSKLKIFKNHLKRDCDKNKDGEISLREATSNTCYMDSDTFLKYSKGINKKFKISDIKYMPKDDKEDRINHLIDMCDKNSDLKLTLVEATSKWCHFTSDEFDELDVDKNSYLSKNELYILYKNNSESEPTTIEHMKNAPKQIQLSFAYSICDKNNNSKLSRKEAKKCKLSMKIFDKYDYDKSNSIEQNDLELMREYKRFEIADINSDAKIDFQEFSTRMGGMCTIF